jgi:hypothetical protein
MSENNPSGRAKPSRVWWWIVAACLLQVAVWIVWLIIAAQNRVAEVPLATG